MIVRLPDGSSTTRDNICEGLVDVGSAVPHKSQPVSVRTGEEMYEPEYSMVWRLVPEKRVRCAIKSKPHSRSFHKARLRGNGGCRGRRATGAGWWRNGRRRWGGRGG
jgi:hypothetical protein